MEKTIDNICEQIDNLNRQIRFIGKTQLLIVDKLAIDDREFMAEFIANALSSKQILEGFTEYMFNEVKDVPDDIKTLLMELNEARLEEE